MHFISQYLGNGLACTAVVFIFLIPVSWSSFRFKLHLVGSVDLGKSRGLNERSEE